MSGDPRYSKPDMYIVTPRVPRQPAGIANYFTEMTRKAEEMGYDRAWNIETNDRDAFAQATLQMLGSSTIGVGTNIVSYFSRTPTLLAMGAFTLDELSGGRFILGIGPGGTQIITHGHGIAFEKPVRRCRQTLEIIRPQAVHQYAVEAPAGWYARHGIAVGDRARFLFQLPDVEGDGE
ncbi:MAG: LLM class flavin-dependent oxidoreductase, partial [Nitrospinota bacterium]|nr:LLM class flavin-dependent oxidoreductase [Nitrospinota bacterium]